MKLTLLSRVTLAHCTARQRARIRAAGIATPEAGHAFARQAVAEYVARHGFNVRVGVNSPKIGGKARPASVKRRTAR